MKTIIATLLFTLSIEQIVFADTITGPPGVQRTIFGDGAAGAPNGSFNITSNTFGTFNQSDSNTENAPGRSASATANQNTSAFLTSTSIGGSGSGGVMVTASSSPNAGTANALSSMQLDFTIDAPFTFSLSGTTSLSGAISSDDGAYIQLRNIGNSSVKFTLGTTPNGGATGPSSGTLSGTIPAGQYHFDAVATFTVAPINSTESGSASFSNLSFSVAPVPEPSTATLLMLMGTAFVIRRKRPTSSRKVA